MVDPTMYVPTDNTSKMHPTLFTGAAARSLSRPAATAAVAGTRIGGVGNLAATTTAAIVQSPQPTMVDVGGKAVSLREAKARCRVVFPRQTMGSVLHFEGRKELMSAKGPVFSTAIVAGVMGAKKTSELIPFCHPLSLEDCHIDIRFDEDMYRPNEVLIDCTVRVQGKTGVEMEAMSGASIAALCIYDMCKATSHDILIKDLQLLSKSGGKRDVKRNEVITTIPFPPSSPNTSFHSSPHPASSPPSATPPRQQRQVVAGGGGGGGGGRDGRRTMRALSSSSFREGEEEGEEEEKEKKEDKERREREACIMDYVI
ncbi:molybdenum cofactor biosynthesis protein [Nannochloropsis oceanica]